MTAHTLRKILAASLLAAFTLTLHAAEAVFRIVGYNATTGTFLLAASGQVPEGSYAWFENDYGATTGNRYNQIPRNRQAALHLEGWQGCTVRAVTLSMCSNNRSGQVGLSVTDGGDALFTQRPTDFSSPEWAGQWVSKDFNAYVDITRQLQLPAFTAEESSIVLKGGTSEGSVYVSTFTIDYDESPSTPLASPLGWSYEKLPKKGTLSVGDVVMVYRNGCAAADLGGMQESHYLDALAIASTTDVTEPEVLRFTLGAGSAKGFWTLTDQHGRQLGTTGKQSLAWDEGTTEWAITPGYDGATIESAKASAGTLRFNAPEGSYARFNVYTSQSLPLPHLYVRRQQREPVVARALTLESDELTVALTEGHLALHPTLQPASVTDQRIRWNSTNKAVATVNGGFVTLLSPGEATLTARTADGGAEASVRLTVTPDATGINTPSAPSASSANRPARKMIRGTDIRILTPNGLCFGTRGERR